MTILPSDWMAVTLDFKQLIMSIGDYIDGENKNPKPFISTARESDIHEKITRGQAAVNNRRSA
jgi:hypothetical protein